MTNTGTEKPSTEKPITTRSIQEPCRYAASTPSGTAISIASTIVSTASDSVGSMPVADQLGDGLLEEE